MAVIKIELTNHERRVLSDYLEVQVERDKQLRAVRDRDAYGNAAVTLKHMTNGMINHIDSERVVGSGRVFPFDTIQQYAEYLQENQHYFEQVCLKQKALVGAVFTPTSVASVVSLLLASERDIAIRKQSMMKGAKTKYNPGKYIQAWFETLKVEQKVRDLLKARSMHAELKVGTPQIVVQHLGKSLNLNCAMVNSFTVLPRMEGDGLLPSRLKKSERKVPREVQYVLLQPFNTGHIEVPA